MAPFVRMLIRNGLAIIIAVCAVGYVLPTEIKVERKHQIKANKYDIHFLIENLTQWQKWAVWNQEDAGGTPAIGTNSRGVGASQVWDNDYGEGKIVITRSDPDYGIDYDYYFDDGNRIAKGSIKYLNTGNSVELIWTITGNIDVEFLGGYMRILFEQSHKSFIDRSLSKLASVAENIR